MLVMELSKAAVFGHAYVRLWLIRHCVLCAYTFTEAVIAVVLENTATSAGEFAMAALNRLLNKVLCCPKERAKLRRGKMERSSESETHTKKDGRKSFTCREN